MDSGQDWFDKIYLKYYPKMFNAAMRIVWDRQLAEDIVQSTFETLLLNYDKVRNYENIWGWLLKTVTNKSKNEINRACNRREVSIETMYKLAADDPYEHDNFLEALPRELSEEEKRMLYLHYAVGFKHTEIAKELGCTASASKMRLHRAKVHYQELIENSSG
ncbi:RNA polymerase sigma factor [uncultured Dysosmobacter sp.]|uniref:RNA polymerase sigma factor n=1 Tax=uncultured Dysosmobacter sp. TaxID=2591384 RepID=UPI00262C5C3D|nr:RNA polymerase sigma factor [uncultured Dysosmobacter sp.]